MEIVILSLLCFNILCHWSNVTHWIYSTCLAHRTKLTERKEKKSSEQREKMREELVKQVVAPPEQDPAQQPRQILAPAQPEIIVG